MFHRLNSQHIEEETLADSAQQFYRKFESNDHRFLNVKPQDMAQHGEIIYKLFNA